MDTKARGSRESAREYALRFLKSNIISLELAPGSVISENEIAAQLGLSRTPIREALIELSKVNIVEIMPQKGSRVLLIDYDLVEESRFLRLVLETAIVRQICSDKQELDFSELESNLKLQEFYIQNPSPSKLLELDNQFHRELFKLAKKMRCYQWMIDGMEIHFDRVRSMSLNAIKDTKIVQDHTAILDALRKKNEQQGILHVTKHFSRYEIDKNVIQAIYPKYFL